MHPILNIAIRAVRNAGNLILKNYENSNGIESCKLGNDNFVKNLKYNSEFLIVKIIHKYYPSHCIFTKDKNPKYIKSHEIKWFINSIDSSINFIKRFPYFSISIAVQINNRTEISVIYDPMRNELFTAVRGQGAQLNGYRLRIKNIKSIHNSTIISTNFFIQTKKQRPLFISFFNKLLNNSIQLRCTGSSVLDLAYIATGRLDGYFAINIEFNDYIASELIIKESGGLITDFFGGNNYINLKNIISGNVTIIKYILMHTRKEFNIIDF